MAVTAQNQYIDSLIAQTQALIASQIASVNSSLTTLQSSLTSHTANTNNPHGVTKSQVGLGNVDNTSDANKPVSTAQQTALNGKVAKTGTNDLSGTGTPNTFWVDFGGDLGIYYNGSIKGDEIRAAAFTTEDGQFQYSSGTNRLTVQNVTIDGSLLLRGEEVYDTYARLDGGSTPTADWDFGGRTLNNVAISTGGGTISTNGGDLQNIRYLDFEYNAGGLNMTGGTIALSQSSLQLDSGSTLIVGGGTLDMSGGVLDLNGGQLYDSYSNSISVRTNKIVVHPADNTPGQYQLGFEGYGWAFYGLSETKANFACDYAAAFSFRLAVDSGDPFNSGTEYFKIYQGGISMPNGGTFDMGNAAITNCNYITTQGIDNSNYSISNVDGIYMFGVLDMSGGGSITNAVSVSATNLYGDLIGSFQGPIYSGNGTQLIGDDGGTTLYIGWSPSNHVLVDCGLEVVGSITSHGGISLLSGASIDMGSGDITNVTDINGNFSDPLTIYNQGHGIILDAPVTISGGLLDLGSNRIANFDLSTTYANNAAAIAGGLESGTFYVTSTGEVRCVV